MSLKINFARESWPRIAAKTHTDTQTYRHTHSKAKQSKEIITIC